MGRLGKRVSLLLAVSLLTLICFTGRIESADLPYQDGAETSNVEPSKQMELAQTFDFTLDEWDYRIVQCDYSASHLNTRFTYTLTFSVSGGSLEFFICLRPEANIWAAGSPIFISTSDHWGSTSGVTVTKSFQSNVALAFVFNHEGSGSRTVSGSVTVDGSGPSISTSLVSNATYTGTYTITASATDPSGVDSMEILIDGDSKKNSSSGSINYDWRTTSYDNGLYTVQIRAEDDVGNVNTVTYNVWVENEGFALPNMQGIAILIAMGGLLAACVYWYGNKYGWTKSSTATKPPPITYERIYKPPPVKRDTSDWGRESYRGQRPKDDDDMDWG